MAPVAFGLTNFPLFVMVMSCLCAPLCFVFWVVNGLTTQELYKKLFRAGPAISYPIGRNRVMACCLSCVFYGTLVRTPIFYLLALFLSCITLANSVDVDLPHVGSFGIARIWRRRRRGGDQGIRRFVFGHRLVFAVVHPQRGSIVRAFVSQPRKCVC